MVRGLIWEIAEILLMLIGAVFLMLYPMLMMDEILKYDKKKGRIEEENYVSK